LPVAGSKNIQTHTFTPLRRMDVSSACTTAARRIDAAISPVGLPRHTPTRRIMLWGVVDDISSPRTADALRRNGMRSAWFDTTCAITLCP